MHREGSARALPTRKHCTTRTAMVRTRRMDHRDGSARALPPRRVCMLRGMVVMIMLGAQPRLCHHESMLRRRMMVMGHHEGSARALPPRKHGKGKNGGVSILVRARPRPCKHERLCGQCHREGSATALPTRKQTRSYRVSTSKPQCIRNSFLRSRRWMVGGPAW
jgi:hypothetical protein